MIYMAVLYSSGKRRRWTITEDSGPVMPQLSVSGMGPRGLLTLDFKRQETETWTNCTLDAFKQHFQTLAFGSGGMCLVHILQYISSGGLDVFWSFLVSFCVNSQQFSLILSRSGPTRQVPLGPERLGRVPSRGPARQHGGPLGRGRRTCGDARWLDVHHIISLEDV